VSITKLAAAKSYSKIYFDEADEELQGHLDAAEEFVAKFLNRDDLTDLSNAGESPPPDSPALIELNPIIKTLVCAAFDDFWQNKGMSVIGTTVNDNPTWMRAAHLYRIDLGV
jgi:hypothetical protein